MSGIYDQVQNPIPYSGFFATPDSTDEFAQYLQTFTGTERTIAITVAQMAFNLAHKLVESEILSKEVFCG